ncbi:hypothetical protein MTO96_011161 [Rhipicephalus appendiculatus]
MGCPHRIDSLDGPAPGKEWHIGGWAVRQICSEPLDTLFLRAHGSEPTRGLPLVNNWTKLEAEVTGDVVVFPYNDTFSTIFYKFVGGMRWVTEHCPNVRNIVKIDDDVGVQPFELRRYLDETLPLKNSSIHGFVFVHMESTPPPPEQILRTGRRARHGHLPVVLFRSRHDHDDGHDAETVPGIESGEGLCQSTTPT